MKLLAHKFHFVKSILQVYASITISVFVKKNHLRLRFKIFASQLYMSDLLTFTEDIFNEKLHFFWSVRFSVSILRFCVVFPL